MRKNLCAVFLFFIFGACWWDSSCWHQSLPARRVGESDFSRVWSLFYAIRGPKWGSERTFTNVAICIIKLLNFEYPQERCNVERPLRVYYIHSATRQWAAVMLCNNTWRGQASLLILGCGQRRPDCRDRRGGENSHVFFVPIYTYCSRRMGESGGSLKT